MFIGDILVEMVVDSGASTNVIDTLVVKAEKGALAIVWACKRFHVHLCGIEFELYTDHKPLETIYFCRSRPCARIEWWILRLQP